MAEGRRMQEFQGGPGGSHERARAAERGHELAVECRTNGCEMRRPVTSLRAGEALSAWISTQPVELLQQLDKAVARVRRPWPDAGTRRLCPFGRHGAGASRDPLARHVALLVRKIPPRPSVSGYGRRDVAARSDGLAQGRVGAVGRRGGVGVGQDEQVWVRTSRWGSGRGGHALNRAPMSAER